ncbi:MAG: phosphatase PAP2 family protein [Candidatus Kapaibacterium sp.]
MISCNYNKLLIIISVSLSILLIENTNSLSNPYKFDDSNRNIFLTGAGLIGLGFNLSNNELTPLSDFAIEELMKSDILSINKISVDNYNNTNALISDILLGICLAVPAGQIFDGRVINDWSTYGMMYIETGMFSIGATTITKNIVRDPRPYVYNPKVPIEEKKTKDARLSFFSGHACLAFAGMTFFAETYSKYYPEASNHKLIWLGSMSLASATALLRIFSGRHFPVDILIGSAIGFAVGKLVPLSHENNDYVSGKVEFINNKFFSLSFNL